MSKKERILFAGAVLGIVATAVGLVPNIVNAAKTTDEHPQYQQHIKYGVLVAIGLAVYLALRIRR